MASSAGTRVSAERRRRAARAIAALLAAAGTLLLLRGLAVPAKAHLANVLLRSAWERTQHGEREARPWPWADTWPVARLTVPGRGVDLIVLEGANGRAMAFAPGHAFGTVPPGTRGNSVIAGHRDTHLAFLRDLACGESVTVERPDGARVDYIVDGASRVRETETDVMLPSDATRLTLVTCWPFDALRAGGPWRWVVTASERVEPRLANPMLTSASR
jgi:sortase A